MICHSSILSKNVNPAINAKVVVTILLLVYLDKRNGKGITVKLKHLIASTAVGFAAGWLISKQIQEKDLPPEKALHRVKHQLKGKLAIEGSWIQMVPEKLKKDKLEYTVYRGGITSKEDNVTKHYDFAVDSKTGTILELTRH